MSDAPQGADWWQTSEGKWYPPEQHPDYTAPPGSQPSASAQPVPASSEEPGTQDRTAHNGTLIVVGAVVLLLVVLCGWGWISGSMNSTTYVGRVVDVEVENPASLRVFVEVTNTGDHGGEPSCQVQASDGSGAYFGAETFSQLESIEPGETTRFNGSVVVTSEGAQFANDVSVECE